MIPVMQTKFGNNEGNCFTASLASILEVKLEDVPEMSHLTDGTWFPVCNKFLFERGYKFHGTLYNIDEILAYNGIDGYYIVGGGSPRGCPRGHAVVFYKGKMIHDPHPDGRGITNIDFAYMIEPAELK